ncbi:alpha/beta hydrolase family protein [Nocardia sp. CA-128927]|uniref:alpha/beta hydrolase family protein n=1 Tax=Nocardia sp. CA-128927 TaxID=3239975 RepID=UPI003D984256
MITLRSCALALTAGMAATVLLTACEQNAPEPTTTATAKITLPPLSGRYPVGTTDLHLVDTRPDPWHPADKRELMVTVTYPAQRTGERAAWMSPGVAAAVDQRTAGSPENGLKPGTIDWAGTKRQASTSVEVDRTAGAWPVVLFSHGFGVERELNSVRTDDLASHGYVVVSISHTYDASVVEFPGGRVVTRDASPDTAYLATSVDARVADTRFVLDQLTRLNLGENPDAENRTLPTGLPGALDLSKVGMFGHSLGGYAAGEAMYQDQRIGAGINFDGGMSVGKVGEIVQHGVDRPFMLVGADGVDPETGRKFEHSHPADFDTSWGQFWTNQQAWKRDLHFDAAAHMSFTDLQVAVPQCASLLTEEVRQSIVGTIHPARSVSAQQDYIAAYFDLHLKHLATDLFDGNNPRYPDTRFIP